MERHREHINNNEEIPSIENFEKIFGTEKFEKEISKLSYQEKEKLIANIDFFILEGDPSKKDYRKQFKQAISMHIGTPPGFNPKIRSILDDSYMIDGYSFFIKISDGGNPSILSHIGINSSKFDHMQSYIVKCKEKNNKAWTNLRLFILGNKDGNERKFIYIGDRYVIDIERGKGIGKCLLKLIDVIAKDVGCETIFASLVPEEGENIEKLKKGHMDFGYTIEEQEGAKIAIKKLA